MNDNFCSIDKFMAFGKGRKKGLHLRVQVYIYMCIWANNFMTPTYRPHLLDVVDVRINCPTKTRAPWVGLVQLFDPGKNRWNILAIFLGEISQLKCTKCTKYICLRNVLSIICVFLFRNFLNPENQKTSN